MGCLAREGIGELAPLRRLWPRAGLLILALCGVAVLQVATARGVGVSPDSVAYIAAARGLLQGLGLGSPVSDGHWSPLIHYAPLFPTLLAALGVLGIDPLDGARWLNSFLFAGNVFVAGHIIQWDTGSISSAIYGAALLVISFPMLTVHSMAWSEPIFVLLSLLALLWLSQYAEHLTIGYVVAAAAAVGLGVLARYAGLVLIAAGVGAIVIGNRHARRDALRDGGLFAAISGLLGGLWLIRNWLVAGTLTGRSVAVHLVSVAQLRRGLETTVDWLRPEGGLQRCAAALVATGACALLLHGLAQRLPRPAPPAHRDITRRSTVARTALIFIAGYGLFLLIAISLFDAATPLDDRILSPLFAWALIAVACAAHRVVTGPRRPFWTRALVLTGGMWLATAQLLRVVPWAIAAHGNGQGYTSTAWQQSPIIAQVRALPVPTRIFSNGDDAIYLLTGRLAERIPERISPTTTQANEHYESDLARWRSRLVESHGVVVYFTRIDWRSNLVSATDLRERLTLHALYDSADGTIYAVQE